MNVQIGIDQFVIDANEKANAVGRAYGWDLTQAAQQAACCMKRDIAMIRGVYELGHLRHGGVAGSALRRSRHDR